MNDKNTQNDINQKTVVYKIASMDKVQVQRNIKYQVTDPNIQMMDIYFPPKIKPGEKIPAIIFVLGFSDPRYGRGLKDIMQYVSWGRLVAASGIIAITYTYQDPIADLDSMMQYLKENSESLGIDINKIGLWACSGNVPIALSVLINKSHFYSVKCAAFCYGYMFNCQGHSYVADAAKQFGFVNPCQGKSIKELPQHIPLLIVRAGQDQMPHLNKTIDLFQTEAVANNLSATFINHASAKHAFDLFDDNQASYNVIKNILNFLQVYLLT